MLLDLWSLFLIISDLVDHLKELIDHGSFSFSTFFFFTVLGFLLYFAWQSTDIPDVPPPPHPPYVIQIQANVNTNNVNGGVAQGGTGGRHTLSDVRLLSSGPLVDSVLNRIPTARQHHHQTQHLQHTHGRRSALFFGLLRRPSPRPLLHFRPAARSRFQASNVIVYSQVNVYHSHGRSDEASNPSAVSASASSSVPVVSSSTVPSSADGIVVGNNRVNNTDSGIGSNDVSSRDLNCPLLRSNRSPSQDTTLTDVDFEDNTVDVNVVEVTASDGRQIGVDVDLNGDVTIVEQNLSRSSNTSSSTNVEFTGSNVSVNPNNIVTMSRSGGSSSSNEDKASTDSARSPSSPQGPANPNETDGDVRITLRFLNETQMEVTTQLTEKIADFKRRHFATELSENKVIRLIFNGRVLDNDGKTLQESGIFDQCVVHCLIVTPQSSQQRGSQGGGQGQMGRSDQNARGVRSLRDGPEPGMFFVSVLGIVLIFLWFICFHFGQQLFTQSAVISLIVLTAVFVIGLVALYLPVQS